MGFLGGRGAAASDGLQALQTSVVHKVHLTQEPVHYAEWRASLLCQSLYNSLPQRHGWRDSVLGFSGEVGCCRNFLVTGLPIHTSRSGDTFLRLLGNMPNCCGAGCPIRPLWKQAAHSLPLQKWLPREWLLCMCSLSGSGVGLASYRVHGHRGGKICRSDCGAQKCLCSPLGLQRKFPSPGTHIHVQDHNVLTFLVPITASILLNGVQVTMLGSHWTVSFAWFWDNL
jgi:hypothetical protein